MLQERRLAAVRELVRLVKSGGQVLIYVWAFEQEYNKQKSKYLKDHNKGHDKDLTLTKNSSEENREPREALGVNTQSYNTTENLQEISRVPESKLSVHTNRTAFNSHDLLVPWHLKGGKPREEESCFGVSSTPEPHPGFDSSVLSGSRPSCTKAKHSSGSKQNGDAGQTSGCSSAPVFHRYYHVFEQGELEQLCVQVDKVKVKTSYHDQGNWCVILEKE